MRHLLPGWSPAWWHAGGRAVIIGGQLRATHLSLGGCRKAGRMYDIKWGIRLGKRGLGLAILWNRWCEIKLAISLLIEAPNLDTPFPHWGLSGQWRDHLIIWKDDCRGLFTCCLVCKLCFPLLPISKRHVRLGLMPKVILGKAKCSHLHIRLGLMPSWLTHIYFRLPNVATGTN